MADPRFFRRSGPMTLRELAKISNSKMADVSLGEKIFDDVKTGLEEHWKDFKEILDKKNFSRIQNFQPCT